MSEHNEPASALIDTIKEARGTLAELGDKIITVVDGADVFNKVPIISWAVKALNLKDDYQKYRLKRNCEAFVRELADCKPEDLERLRSTIEQKGAAAEEFIDTTLSILLESVKPIKASFFGKLLRARLASRISNEEFSDLALLIQASSVPALQKLEQLGRRTNNVSEFNEGMRVPEEPYLLSMGIAYRFGNAFRLSEDGKKLLAVLARPSE